MSKGWLDHCVPKSISFYQFSIQQLYQIVSDLGSRTGDAVHLQLDSVVAPRIRVVNTESKNCYYFQIMKNRLLLFIKMISVPEQGM